MDAPANDIFLPYNTSSFSAVRFDETPFTCQRENEDRKAQRCQILHFHWSFLSDYQGSEGVKVTGTGVLPPIIQIKNWFSAHLVTCS